MNVCDLDDDSEPEGQWVKLQGANGLRTFMSYAERAAFFAAHPRIAVERSFTCVTDSAVALVREHRLTGFCFELLWSGKHGPLPDGLKNWERPRLTGLEDRPFDFDGFWAEYGGRQAARAAL